AYRWFEQHGVPLVTQEDQCVFPQAQDSHAIIDCFLSLVRRYHIEIRKGCKVLSLEDVSDFDYVVVTTGGSPKGEGLRWLAELGHEIEAPVPLFLIGHGQPLRHFYEILSGHIIFDESRSLFRASHRQQRLILVQREHAR
ncbi:MAG: NAD(P)/FAD-dependent oxidoreductase, partial [Selenomonadaceae bacterium]|nr:NAD(P)/FAD-dependent oxidoreductase [Selenomonadaceae bacterium]